VVWAGATDGPVHVTRDGGRAWANVTPRGLPPGGRVQTVEPSPHRRGSAYVAVLRYQLGDFRPYIYKTADYGRSWTRLTTGANGIPADQPTRVVREDPSRPGLLYAGTEFGMFVSFDDGARWQPMQLNLPAVPVTDIKVHRGDLVLSTQGRGFYVLDDLAPLRELSDRVAAAPAHLFRPRDAYRIRYQSRFGGAESARQASGDPEYPRAGAMIDYWLAGEPAGEVTLDVLDPAGRVVRSFSSAGAGERGEAPAEASMRAPALERVGAPKLPAKAGLNRFVWDLAYAGPWDANAARSGRNGPMVAPGAYTLRLTAAGQMATQPLAVRADPRVLADGVTDAVLAEQVAHNLRVRDMVTEANQAVARLRAAKERLTSAGAPAADTLARLAAIEQRLVTPAVRYSRPGLQTHIGYLYGLTTQADQRVGRDAVERYQALRAALDKELAAVTAVLGAERAVSGR
jgi:hypothetical protein